MDSGAVQRQQVTLAGRGPPARIGRAAPFALRTSAAPSSFAKASEDMPRHFNKMGRRDVVLAGTN